MTYDDRIIGLSDGTSPSTHQGGGRWVKTLGAIVAVIVLIGGFAAWRFASGFGASTDSASAIPAEVQFYMNIDLALLTDTERLQSITDTFPSISGGDNSVAEDARAEFDRLLKEETGMTVTDDVIPWIGRSAGLGVWGMSADTSVDPSVVIAVKVRDGEAADLFVERLATSQGASIIAVVYDGAVWGVDYRREGMLARAVVMRLLASDA